MEKVIEEIKRLASNRDWSMIDDQPKTSMVSFEKSFDYSTKPVRINVYYKKESTVRNLCLTISTAMDHPTKGKTQLFRKNQNNSSFIKLLNNPRLHTGKGYYKK